MQVAIYSVSTYLAIATRFKDIWYNFGQHMTGNNV